MIKHMLFVMIKNNTESKSEFINQPKSYLNIFGVLTNLVSLIVIKISRFEETQIAGVNIIMKNGLTDYVSRRCFAKIRKALSLNEKVHQRFCPTWNDCCRLGSSNFSYDLFRFVTFKDCYQSFSCSSKPKYYFQLNSSFYCRGNKCYFQSRTNFNRYCYIN